MGPFFFDKWVFVTFGTLCLFNLFARFVGQQTIHYTETEVSIPKTIGTV